MFKGVKPIIYGGHEVWPLVEGGKGVAATNHASAGAWAAAGGIGTVSAVNADSYDPEGKIIPQVYSALTRRDRHEELIQYAIDGAVEQVRRHVLADQLGPDLAQQFGLAGANEAELERRAKRPAPKTVRKPA